MLLRTKALITIGTDNPRSWAVAGKCPAAKINAVMTIEIGFSLPGG
jgi:hypothetical protein